MGLSEDKIELRKKFKEIRKQVFINDGENFSFLISNFLQNIIKKKDKIALYISFNSEVKTMDLIQTLVLNDYQVCLLAGILISVWPFSPNGNFFNNWLAITYSLPIGFYLHSIYERKNLNLFYRNMNKKI